MQHSSVVGGSTAKRVINCPASVELSNKMPPRPSSKDADKGTLLHNVMALHLEGHGELKDFLGMKYEDITLTQDMIDDKLQPAIDALMQIDPESVMEYAVEQRVEFGSQLPGVFGSTDLIGRVGDRVISLDWKFGDGVMVEAEENPQGLFYTAAARYNPDLAWVFDGAKDIEIVIVQPPYVRRWVTTFDRLRLFERELVLAVKQAQGPNPPLRAGDHCRWCAAKPICPAMNGAQERVMALALKELEVKQLGAALDQVDLVEQRIADLRALAQQVLESGGTVPGYKLVAKRGTRKWINEAHAMTQMHGLLKVSELLETSMLSPAQVEKKLKKLKLELPEGLTTTVSSGNTMASEDDPRPAVLLIGQQMTAALAKLI